MNQRPTFQCWNCPKAYTLLRDITTQQTLTVACPYCKAEAVVDLTPFRKKIIHASRGTGQEQDLAGEWDLPAVLPTSAPK